PWYVETKSPNPKHVIIVIDNSGSMVTDYNDKALIEYAKESTITVLNTLNPNDKVSVITFSDDVTLPPGTDGRGCFRTNLAQATPLNIDHFETFVNSVPTAGGTKYKEALNTAFDLLNASRPTDDEKR
ncbi:inter-alpha-trypsin inhibitor heavy chain H3-like, partial [Saccoglossus kowalevskii]